MFIGVHVNAQNVVCAKGAGTIDGHPDLGKERENREVHIQYFQGGSLNGSFLLDKWNGAAYAVQSRERNERARERSRERERERWFLYSTASNRGGTT